MNNYQAKLGSGCKPHRARKLNNIEREDKPMTTGAKDKDLELKREDFVIGWNDSDCPEPCKLCGRTQGQERGLRLLERRSLTSVCWECGAKYAPELTQALKEHYDAAWKRSWTCLDEQKTAELWARSEPRYIVLVIAPHYKGYTNVYFGLFHHKDMTDAEIAPLVVLTKGRTLKDLGCPRSYVEQTFSKTEVRQLHRYFSHRTNLKFEVRRAEPPDNHLAGWGTSQVGGFYSFDKVEGYPLPFKVRGYYNPHPYYEEQESADIASPLEPIAQATEEDDPCFILWRQRLMLG